MAKVSLFSLPNVMVTVEDQQAAQQLSNQIKIGVGGRDRANPKMDTNVISYDGLCLERAAVRLFSKYAKRDADEVLYLIEKCREDGSNYGHDIPGHLFGLKKDIETKGTEYFGADSGLLFMRCLSGCTEEPTLEYWADVLPDSYYALFINRNPRFYFAGWATRDLLLANYQIWLDKYIQKLGPGYPTIGIVHHMANRPAAFLSLIKPVQ